MSDREFLRVGLMDWLDSIGKNLQWLSRELKRPRSTLRDAALGISIPGTDVSLAIVDFSESHPGPSGEAVDIRELAGDAPEPAAEEAR